VKPDTFAQKIESVKQQAALLHRFACSAAPEHVTTFGEAFDAISTTLAELEVVGTACLESSPAPAEQAHASEHDLLQTLMDSIPDGIYFKDTAGRFIKINRGQVKNLGITGETEALGKTDFDFFGIEHAQEAWEDEQRIMATREPMLDCLEHYVGTDGSEVWVSASKVPMFDRNGDVIGIAGISRDITERKSVDIVLQREQEFLKTLLASMAEGIVACDAEGVLTLLNDAAREFHHLPHEPIPASQWAQHYDLFLPDGRTPMRQEDIPLFRALHGESVRNVEMMIVPKHGRPRTVLSNGNALYGAEGQKIGAVVAMHDITERKQAEEALQRARDELEMRVAERTAELRAANARLEVELAEREHAERALRESEIRFRTLVEQSPLSTQIMSTDGRIVLVNRAWEQLWGVTLDQLAEYNFLQDPQLVAKGLMPYLRRGFAGEALELPAVLYDPNETLPDLSSNAEPERWTRAFIYPVRDEAARIRQVVLVHQDITDEMRAKAELQESENRFRQLAEHINEIFWMYDAKQLRMLYISPAYKQVWGQVRASLDGDPRSFVDAVHVEDRERVLAALEQQQRGVQTLTEYRIVRPDGTLRWIRDQGFPIKDESGHVYRVAGLAEDITERQRAEEERAELLVREQAARAEAEAAIVVRDEFLSIASHELKTPVTSLVAYSQMLERRAQRGGTLPERDRRAVHVLADQATRLSRLIDSLLDISRIQTGHFTLNRAPVDLGALCTRVVTEVQETVERHTVECVILEEPVTVEGDDLRLEQMLQNLVQNAIKYSPNGGAIRVTIRQDDGHAVLAVSDQGIGIPQEEYSHLFQRFYRAGNSANSVISGMGLGLYVVKEIVERHAGMIEVVSTEGQGSTFTVRLPLLAPVPAPSL